MTKPKELFHYNVYLCISEKLQAISAGLFLNIYSRNIQNCDVTVSDVLIFTTCTKIMCL